MSYNYMKPQSLNNYEYNPYMKKIYIYKPNSGIRADGSEWLTA